MLARSDKMATVQGCFSPETWLLVEGRLEDVRRSTTRMKNNEHRHKLGSELWTQHPRGLNMGRKTRPSGGWLRGSRVTSPSSCKEKRWR